MKKCRLNVGKIEKKGDSGMTQETKPNLIRKYRVDVIVIAALLLLSLLLLLVMTFTRQEGAYAEVTLDGQAVAKYPLSVNGTYPLNNGTNVLVIENGVAYMSYSNCPDHVCENTGRIRYVGQTIVCLPNRLTVTIVGTSDQSVDFVS